jgi:4'-phosphopantetheinyl transferase
MTVRWISIRNEAVPPNDTWLGPVERAVQEKLTIAKRRSDWRLGRYAAKQLLAEWIGLQSLDRIQIIAAEDGAPEVHVDERPIDVNVSLSHRQGLAVAALHEGGGRVGCDLELIEPRTPRFIEDYFTALECECVSRTPAPLRDRHVALTWSGKESALKLLRTGLRRDTRSLEVEVAHPLAAGDSWSALKARVHPEDRTLTGRWRQLDSWVLTIVTGTG